MNNLFNEKERAYSDKVSKKFKVVLNYYFEDYFEQNPEYSSSLGLKRYDCSTKDYSDHAYEKELDLNQDVQKKLKMIDPYNLSFDEHIDYLLLNSRVKRFIFDHENLPDYRKNNPQLYLPTSGIYCMLIRTLKDEDRLKSIASRLNAVPKLIDQAKTNLYNPPKIWTETTINQLKYIKNFFSNIHEIDLIKNASQKFPELGNNLIEGQKQCLAALNEYERYLQVELIEKSKGQFCVGRQAFDFYLSNDHFLDYTNGSLNTLGYELFNKTLSDISTLCIQIDKSKSPEVILNELEETISPAEKLMETYIQLVNRTKSFVIDNNLITFPENEQLKVIETPKYLRDIIPFAAYYALGPYEESNIGQFWVSPVDESDKEKQRQLLMSGHNLNKLPSVVLHEAYPGHHLQLMLAKKALFENNTTAVRKTAFDTLLIEGWALYCEQMMGEVGFYSTQQKIMMLKMRLWRAARVILDTELHAGRTSFDEAVRFMVSKLNMSESFAKAEVTRYTMTPTQPLSYEVGRRLINQIRDKQKIKLQDKFSLKEFHDKLLSKGSLPIRLIEELAFNQKIEVMK